MLDPEERELELLKLVAGLRAGSSEARDELIRRTSDRLVHLTRKMLKDYRRVRRWADTDDVLQGALIRLVRALKVASPDSAQGFFRLAATQVRRELNDLARHYFGPQGMGANHVSTPDGEAGMDARLDKKDSTHDPRKLAEWTEFHRLAGELAEVERAVFELRYYQGVTQAEAAEILGVDITTIQRRELRAKKRLQAMLHDQVPGR